MWKVTIQGDAQSPYEIDDGQVLNQFLSQQKTTTVIMVDFYDVVKRSTVIYGLVNDPALPIAPNPPLQIEAYTQNGYKRS